MKITYSQLAKFMAAIDATTLRHFEGGADIDAARTEDGRRLDPEQRAILLRLDKDMMRRWHRIAEVVGENTEECRRLLNDVLAALQVDPKTSTVAEVAAAFGRLDADVRAETEAKFDLLQSLLRTDAVLREQTVFNDEHVPA